MLVSLAAFLLGSGNRNVQMISSPITLKLFSSKADLIKADQYGLKQCENAIWSSLSTWRLRQVTPSATALVLYHVGFLGPLDSFAMNEININIFLSSLAYNTARNSTFIVVNISGGAYNPLKRVVDNHLSHNHRSCSLLWSATESDMLTHALTLAIPEIRGSEFGTVFALNNGVRGPLARRNTWIEDFQSSLLGSAALVGATMSCEKEPHVQTHMFAFSSEFFNFFLENELTAENAESWLEVIDRSEVRLSRRAVASGFDIGSMLHRRHWAELVFNGSCRPELGKRNPTGWCQPYFTDSIFLKWGGEFFRQGLYCDRVLSYVERVSDIILDDVSSF